jgi:hypothetical protein
MTTEATVENIPAIVDEEANRRAADVAATAAAQIDQAQKDAEAIARAAQQTELGSHIQRIEQETATWRAQMEANLRAEAEARAAQAEALKASILEAISKPPLPEAPPVVVEAEPANVSEEPKPNSKPQDTTTEKTLEKRRRVFL